MDRIVSCIVFYGLVMGLASQIQEVRSGTSGTGTTPDCQTTASGTTGTDMTTNGETKTSGTTGTGTTQECQTITSCITGTTEMTTNGETTTFGTTGTEMTTNGETKASGKTGTGTTPECQTITSCITGTTEMTTNGDTTTSPECQTRTSGTTGTAGTEMEPTPGTAGTTTTASDPCKSISCKNGGSCDRQTSSCNCKSGWIGKHCDMNVAIIIAASVGAFAALVLIVIIVIVTVHCVAKARMTKTGGESEGSAIMSSRTDDELPQQQHLYRVYDNVDGTVPGGINGTAAAAYPEHVGVPLETFGIATTTVVPSHVTLTIEPDPVVETFGKVTADATPNEVEGNSHLISGGMTVAAVHVPTPSMGVSGNEAHTMASGGDRLSGGGGGGGKVGGVPGGTGGNGGTDLKVNHDRTVMQNNRNPATIDYTSENDPSRYFDLKKLNFDENVLKLPRPKIVDTYLQTI